MSQDSARKPLRRTIRGGRPFFFSDPAIDKVLNMTITLASEVWALRERLSALEGVQVRQGSLSVSDVDDYEFTPEEETKLGAQRREYIENLFRVLQEHVEAAAATSKTAGAKLAGKPPVFGARISGIRKTPKAPAKRAQKAAPRRARRSDAGRSSRRSGRR